MGFDAGVRFGVKVVLLAWGVSSVVKGVLHKWDVNHLILYPVSFPS